MSGLDGMCVEVAVIGMGPSGAVAAALFGQAGLSTLVVERQPDVYAKPRAIALDHEIMRVFQQIGVADEVARCSAPFTPSEYFGADGQLIKRLATAPPPYPLGYVPSMVFTQPPVEAALRARVAALPDVQLALGTELVALTQDAEQVALTLRGQDGAHSLVKARYVVGCDGASSSVRAALGILLDDLTFDEPWLVVDVLVNPDALARLPQTSVQFCEPGRPCSYVIGPDNHRRWEISLLEGEDPAYMATEEGAWSLLQRWITPADATMWRQACYRFHALVAHRWRDGRVFLAGDAAHQQPPFLGQGMCQGVRDVANLAWKIQSVLAGDAGPAMLDTYGEERGLHVRQLTGRIKDIGRLICERDPVAARARDARLLDEAGGTIQTTTRQDIIPRLAAGLLSASAGSATGSLFPQPKVRCQGEDVLMDAAAGYGWRVVTNLPAAGLRDAADGFATVVSVPELAAAGDGGFPELEGVMARWFAHNVCSIALVRPDHYVFGTAPDGAGLAALVAEARAALHPV